MTSLQNELKSLMGHCVSLHGMSLVPVPDENGNFTDQYKKVPSEKAIKEWITTLCNDETDSKKVADKIIVAYNKGNDSEELRALNAARIWTVGNFIYADSNFRSGFFETVTLGPSDEPYFVNETLNETRVTDIGEDGTPQTVRVLRNADKFNIGLFMVASDYVKYSTLDLYKGDVSAVQKATFNIGRDLTFKLDRKHYTLLTAAQASGGAFGAFTYESATRTTPTKANRCNHIYVAHSGIVTDHLPTTNDITNAAVQSWDPTEEVSSETGFRPAIMKAIVAYENRWGNLLPDNRGRLRFTGEIIVPSSDIEDMGKYLEVKNGTPETDLQRQVDQNGFASISLWGRNWKFIPDVTIESGVCYPISNHKVGLSFDKPNMAGEDLVQNKLQHWEKRAQSRAWGATIISQWRPAAIRITYE